MKNISIWQKYQQSNYQKENLKNNMTDILIIGGGITGLTTAYFLKDTYQTITLIDKSTLSSGITAKTTAKITYLQQDIYQKIQKYHTTKIAKQYFKSQKEAINLIIQIINNNHISCDLKKTKSILFTTNSKGTSKIKKEQSLLSSWQVTTKKVTNNFIKSGFSVEDTYTFNPIKYLNSLRKIISNKVTINEFTRATSITKKNDIYQVTTTNGIINAKIVVIACHYPFFIYPNLFPIKTHIEREYINAKTIKENKNYTAINIDKQLHSIRYYQDYIIYGSNNHKLTNKIDYQKNYYQSKKDFIKYFHQNPTYTWMNQDIISNDLLPFIGKLKNNLYISSAYNTWGMTNATIGSKLLTDLIKEKDNPYQTLFNPNRINLPLIFNSFITFTNYLKAYIESLFHKSNPYYIKIKGLIYGIYIDKLGIKHKIKLICPHLECPLVFNKEEQTWDCPCHGSRFDLDGFIIEGPAIKNINCN